MDYENDEKKYSGVSVITSSAAALAAPQVITVSRFEWVKTNGRLIAKR